MSHGEGKRDLQHFLRLSLAQAIHRVRQAETDGTDRTRVNRMRALVELIKEQVPSNVENKTNPRPPTGSVG